MSRLGFVARELWHAVRAAPAGRVAALPELRPPVQGHAFVASKTKHFDEWSTLQDLSGPAAQKLLVEERAAEKHFFSDKTEFAECLQAEAASLCQPEEKVSAEVHGAYCYFQEYTPEGFVVFRRKRLNDGVLQVLVDTGELAREANSGFADIRACKVSDDHGLLAYVVDVIGDETYSLHIASLGPTNNKWSACVPNVRSVEFLGCGDEHSGVEVLVVHADPQTKRACRVSKVHMMPAQAIVQSVLWEEKDEAAYLELFRTKDRQFVLLSSNTKDMSKVRVLRCNNVSQGTKTTSFAVAEARAIPMLTPREGVEYFAEHRDGVFYVISNHERPDFAVYKLPICMLDSADEGWQHLEPFFTPPGGMHVTDADLVKGWLVLYGHEAAAPCVCAVPLDTDSKGLEPYMVQLPTSVGSVEPGVNADCNAPTVRFVCRSPITPGSTYDLELATRRLVAVSHREWAPGVELGPQTHVCEIIQCPARDGELIPITIARPRWNNSENRAGGPQPCLLHVYGAYGSCMFADFRPENVLLLQRGWTIAWAHIRGGSERGRSWHSAARQLKKAQSIVDLADASNFLMARGLVAPGMLCIKASSAGGLTLGALLNSNRAAALIGAAVLEVPFVDILTGMRDPSLPLTVHEFAEWGDPSKEEHEANLRSLSPYENIGCHRYPPMYLSCAMEDTRVPPWMPLKFVARLRARKLLAKAGVVTGFGRGRRSKTVASQHSSHDAIEREKHLKDASILLHCTGGGHSGAADWHGQSEAFVSQIIFLYQALGLMPR